MTTDPIRAIAKKLTLQLIEAAESGIISREEAELVAESMYEGIKEINRRFREAGKEKYLKEKKHE
jgi:hypothetical protein